MTFLLETAHGSAENGHATNPVSELLCNFGVDGPHLTVQLINFGSRAVGLWKWAIKPALGTLEQRTAIIEKGLADAAAAEKRLAEANKTAEARLNQAADESANILAQARAAAKQVVEAAKAEAVVATTEVIRRGQEAIEADRRRMQVEFRTDAARLVVETAAKVLEQSLDDATKTRLNEAATKQLAR
jgi:F-type H+-transporting ATPase subunit b